MFESFWGGMQTKLLNPSRWKTRRVLASAVFDHLEILTTDNAGRTLSGTRAPIELELLNQATQPVA